MTKKNQRQLLIWGLTLFICAITGGFFIANLYDQQVFNQHQIYLTKEAKFLTHLSKQNTEDFKKLASNYAKDTSERITFLNADGDILFDTSDDTLVGKRSNRLEIKAVLQGNNIGVTTRKSDTFQEEQMYIALPIKENGNIRFILRLSEATKQFFPQAKQIKRGILAVYSLISIFLSSTILVMINRKNRPLETVLPVLKRMIAHPENHEIIVANSTQWQELYQSINQLSELTSETYSAYNTTEKQFYHLLNKLTIGIFILDSTGEISMMNKAMREQLGITEPLSPNSNFLNTIFELSLIQMIYRIRENHEVLKKTIHYKKNQCTVDVTLHYFPETKQILGISYDVTRVHQLEKMQKDFVGNVSHELKTPVTSLIGFTETLLDGAKEDPELLQSFLEIMQKDAYRLDELIREIILLSKDEETTYEIRPIHIYQLLKQILTNYQKEIDKKQLQIQIIGSKELIFYSKVEFLQPILKNLIENAIRYSFDNGTIELSFFEKNGLSLSVKDSGLGIETDEQARIFERFYRVDKARSRNSGGSGLGLAIVKDYVHYLNGTLTLDSHLGLGSTFTIFLPH